MVTICPEIRRLMPRRSSWAWTFPSWGGDVCHLSEEDLGYTGTNWSCDPIESESLPDYARRSIERTIDYISRVNWGPGTRFVLVLPRGQGSLQRWL